MKISNVGAVLLCVTGMVIVGSSVSISQLILDYPALTGQAARYALAAVVLFAIARRWPRFGLESAPSTGTPTRRPADRAPGPTGGWPTRREWLILTVLAAIGLAAFNAFILIALPHAEPALVGTFIGAAPLGLALLGPLLRGGRPTVRLIGAAGVVVAGTALVQGTGRADAIGVLASLGALAGEIAFSLLAAAVLPRLGPVRVAAYSCALAVPLLLVAALVGGEPARWRAPTGVETATYAYLAALMTVVAFVAWFTGLRRLGVERAGILVGVMPVATLVTAAVQAGRPPTLGSSLGVLVVVLGLTLGLSARPHGERPARPEPAADQSEPEPAVVSTARTASA
ncbi:drug/metabolite transporter (DMT)-like permease [Micromonospora pisi]|uniref:Drug/metabolite transporter (DMT)-like permease n=1 Tax=Micromonospora pisi TaxID=589240 RepID=A0A495JMI5_9ACTN|nr:DMT family transporter [Micromonospora pisi]RKR90226.1 drug/metabolite transporter (DMT)-like permease [Micromonospora pisi]